MSTRRKATKPRPRPSSTEAAPCGHCGTERIVAPLHILVGLQRAHPLPGFGDVLDALGRWYKPAQLIAVCPGCMCTTADLGAHSH